MKKGTQRVLIVLAFVIGLSYFAFTLTFFDPFEGSYMDGFDGTPAVALEFAVPREVDFFVHKRGLASDFEQGNFPVPDRWDEIRLARNFQRFEETPLEKRLEENLEIGKHVEELREFLQQVPLLDVREDMVGRDFALFGRLKGYGADETQVGAVFLGSQLARFAYEAVGNSVLRSVFSVPVEVEDDASGVRTFTLADGKKFYAHRHLDLFVVANAAKLVTEVTDLLAAGREQSLGYSRGYHTTVAQDVTNFAGTEVRGAETGPSVEQRMQLHGRLQSLFSLTKADDDFLEPRGELSRWTLAKLFNPRFFQAVTLDVGMGDAIELRGTLGFDRALAEATESGFYDRPTFELRKAMDRVATVLPEDTFFVMAARVDMKKFLPSLVNGLTEVDKDARQILDDLIANVRKLRPDFRATNAMEAAHNVAAFLGDDVVVALKRDTYFGVPEHPLPLLAIFFEVTDRGPGFDELKQAMGDPSKSKGYNGFLWPIVQARNQLKTGSSSVANWFNVTHNPGTPDEVLIQEVLLSGTADLKNVAFGIIEPVKKETGPWQFALVLSPRIERREVPKNGGGTAMEDFGSGSEMITDFIKLAKERGNPVQIPDKTSGGTRQIHSLLKSDKYQQGSSFLDGYASVAMFVDFLAMKNALLDRSNAVARDATEIDWAPINQRITDELLAGPFAAWKGKEMPKNIKDDYDAKFAAKKEPIVAELEQRRNEVDIPKIRRAYEESLAWVDLFKDAFLAARIDDKEQIIELRARIRTNLEQ